MGQILNTDTRMTAQINDTRSPKKSTEPRYLTHEVPNNGLILNDVYFPDEIIVQILSYVHSKHLLKNCLYVCQKWTDLIQHEVWKVKAEREYLHKLSGCKPYRRLPDLVYQGICCHVGYNCNLLQNNSGQSRFKGWEIIEDGGDRWRVESPPKGVTRPDDATYEEPKHCFVTSYGSGKKRQVIDLVKKGIHPLILDEFQPEIQVSEWYAARWDCTAWYQLDVYLMDENHTEIANFQNNIFMRDELHINGWHVMSHTFKNYGPGVRFVVFNHAGRDLKYWAGHYGAKMANAQVVVSSPNI